MLLNFLWSHRLFTDRITYFSDVFDVLKQFFVPFFKTKHNAQTSITTYGKYEYNWYVEVETGTEDRNLTSFYLHFKRIFFTKLLSYSVYTYRIFSHDCHHHQQQAHKIKFLLCTSALITSFYVSFIIISTIFHTEAGTLSNTGSAAVSTRTHEIKP